MGRVHDQRACTTSKRTFFIIVSLCEGLKQQSHPPCSHQKGAFGLDGEVKNTTRRHPTVAGSQKFGNSSRSMADTGLEAGAVGAIEAHANADLERGPQSPGPGSVHTGSVGHW